MSSLSMPLEARKFLTSSISLSVALSPGSSIPSRSIEAKRAPSRAATSSRFCISKARARPIVAQIMGDQDRGDDGELDGHGAPTIWAPGASLGSPTSDFSTQDVLGIVVLDDFHSYCLRDCARLF